MDHAPIQEQYREAMNVLAGFIDETLNRGQRGSDRKIGFALLMFPFGEVEGRRINYIGNGERKDVLTAIKELVARWEQAEQPAAPEDGDGKAK